MSIYMGYASINNFLNNNELSKNPIANFHVHQKAKYNKYMAFGDSLHVTMAKYNLAHDNKLKSLTFIQNLLKESWISYGYENSDVEKQFFEKALNIVKTYYENPKDIHKRLLLVEEMLTKQVNDDITLFGKADKVSINNLGQLEIIDYKTSFKVNYNLNPYIDAQLPLYLILIKYRLGYYPKLISYYYLTHNIKVTYPVKSEDIARIEQHFANIMSKIHARYISNHRVS